MFDRSVPFKQSVFYEFSSTFTAMVVVNVIEMQKKWIYILIWVAITAMTGCRFFDSTPKDNIERQGKEQDSLLLKVRIKPIYITNIDQLRLRRYPDTKSKILTTFDENALLYFLEEQTDYVEKIGKYKGPWLRVKSIDGAYEGWVYGAPHFVTPFLKKGQIDSLARIGKGVQPFENVARKDMADMTGMNWSNAIPGTRYSGYYTYNLKNRPDLIDGRVIIRTKIIDHDTHQIKFIPCHIDFKQGMAISDAQCLEPITK